MILTFRNSRFHLENVPTEKTRIPYAGWTCKKDGTLTTTDLRAANAFRGIADPNAEKFFKRAFQEHYKIPVPPRGLIDLLDYHQVQGVAWILGRKRSYLAHAPGAGKTVEAVVASCLSQGDGPTLFIVPPSLILNWEREIHRFAPLAGLDWPTVSIVPPSPKMASMNWKADFILCPDSLLDRGWVYARLEWLKPKFIAVDEASRFKEASSIRSLVFYGGRNGDKTYPGLFQDARHVVMLDGSPMPNRAMELWAPTYALHPQAIDCMGAADFGYRYGGATVNERGQWEFKYSSNEAELKERLQKDFMHVVLEKQLSHPERLRSLLFLKDEDDGSAELKAWERRNLSLVAGPISEKISQGEMASHRRLLGMRKVEPVVKLIRERLEEKSEQILLFVWHREVVEGLFRGLSDYNPGVIMGGVPVRLREERIAEFQAKKRRLLILNITAGGRGNNIQAADLAFFAEYSWSSEQNLQCEKRASRRGSDKLSIRCLYGVLEGTFDEVVLKSLFAKETRVQKVIG